MRREVLKHASGIVLEIGSGPGYNLPLYLSPTKLYALEPSRELVDVARTKLDTIAFPVEFLVTGAEHIPLPDNSVDTVVSTWTLCSVGDPPTVLQEIRRVLKPGGKFLFMDHGASPKKVTHALQTFFTSITKHFTGNCHYDRQFGKLIPEAGLDIERMDHPPERHKPLIYNYQGIAHKPIS